MTSESIRYTHMRIIPTVMVLVVSLSLFTGLLGYIWGFARGQADHPIPNENINLIPPFNKPKEMKPIIPSPTADPSGYEVL
jgi:hypothetical protein